MALPTERIRFYYKFATGWNCEERTDLDTLRAKNEAEFDEWLAAHEQEVRERVAADIEAAMNAIGHAQANAHEGHIPDTANHILAGYAQAARIARTA